jgi:hypothetical protein
LFSLNICVIERDHYSLLDNEMHICFKISRLIER